MGTALADPEMMDHAGDLLPSDFTGTHVEIWSEMVVLHRRGALELRALVEALRERDILDDMGASDAERSGEAYIAELMSYRGDAMDEYVRRVIGASTKRQLGMTAALIAADARDEDRNPEEVLDEAERRLMSIRRGRGMSLGASMGDLMSILTGRIDGMRGDTFEPAWVPRISPIRDVVSYFDDNDYVIMAARPGEGKSSAMRYEFIKASLDGVPTLLFNLENGEIEYARYAIAMVTGIDSEKLRNPKKLTDEEMNSIAHWTERLQRIPLYVVTLGAPSVTEVERIARQHISKNKVQRIGLDYIQLINNGLQNRVNDVTLSSTTLRGIAQQFKIPLMAAAQMSRAIEHRGENAEPQLSDLRESGSLEQDGTVIIFPRALWSVPSGAQLEMFPENREPNGTVVERAIPIKFHIKKNRNGRTGVSIPTLWNKATNDFRALTHEREWQQ